MSDFLTLFAIFLLIMSGVGILSALLSVLWRIAGALRWRRDPKGLDDETHRNGLPEGCTWPLCRGECYPDHGQQKCRAELLTQAAAAARAIS